MSQGWSTPRCSSPRGRNPRRNSPGWRRFEVSQRRARSSRPKSRLPRSRNFLKPTVALISSNVAAAASIVGASRRYIEGSSHRHPSRYGTALDVGGLILQCTRSEEHTSELQSRFDLVCRLLLEKKKKY